MVDILDEVEEDIRYERMLRMARRYGAVAVMAAILVLIGVGAQEFWQAHKKRVADEYGTRYLALTQAVDQPGATISPQVATDAATNLVKFADSAPETYKILAFMRAAALYANMNETPKAAALWTRVAADEAAPRLIRDAANLLWAEHDLGTAKDADLLARLQPMVLAGNPYHGLARSLQAMVYLHEGNVAMAKSLFSQVQNDPSVTSGVRSRAAAMLTQLNG